MASKKLSKPEGVSSPNETPRASFETKLAELEEILRQLEEGEKPLDESLDLYERGVAALKDCHAVLDRAEKRIRLLVRRPDGETELRDAKDSEGEVDSEDESGSESTGKARRRPSDAAPRAKPAEDTKAEGDRGSLFGGR